VLEHQDKVTKKLPQIKKDSICAAKGTIETKPKSNSPSKRGFPPKSPKNAIEKA